MPPRLLHLLCVTALFAALSPAIAAKRVPRPLALTWIFAVHDNNQGEPRGKVYLRVNNKRLLVETNVSVHYQVLERNGYPDHNIPTTALTACTGWFAGGGEDIYVSCRGNTLEVYRRWIEEREPIPPYRLFRILPLSSSPHVRNHALVGALYPAASVHLPRN